MRGFGKPRVHFGGGGLVGWLVGRIGLDWIGLEALGLHFAFGFWLLDAVVGAGVDGVGAGWIDGGSVWNCVRCGVALRPTCPHERAADCHLSAPTCLLYNDHRGIGVLRREKMHVFLRWEASWLLAPALAQRAFCDWNSYLHRCASTTSCPVSTN
ncbi:hypothetical protein K505DRAFT_138671 [Melanomma pulvis-pyrius CBS 109.77]|uniref:Uncharacterized protein n=1 Tax=Melanomma pulvis-pyrius CBS 109.77 TaxID=1314802 RepID=A0A6A6WS79_9PLEO|nr:hypothetical protein K505DRAFT_138671 [Melanomma pulvis-pyrius CBS 109.77]